MVRVVEIESTSSDWQPDIITFILYTHYSKLAIGEGPAPSQKMLKLYNAPAGLKIGGTYGTLTRLSNSTDLCNNHIRMSRFENFSMSYSAMRLRKECPYPQYIVAMFPQMTFARYHRLPRHMSYFCVVLGSFQRKIVCGIGMGAVIILLLHMQPRRN